MENNNNNNNKENVKEVMIKKIILDESSKIHPQQIVINNAKVLANVEPGQADELFRKQLNDILATLDKCKDTGEYFMNDIKSLAQIQIALAALSLAVEYWLMRLQVGKIKVYGAQDLPKKQG